MTRSKLKRAPDGVVMRAAEHMNPTAKRALIAVMAQRLGRLQALLDVLKASNEVSATATAQAPPQDASTPST